MTNYIWTIAALECATEENGLNKVVKTVHWRYKGTDETSGISYELFGAQAMDAPNTAAYIPYDQLTEATVISWLEKKLDIVAFQASIAAEIERIQNPPIIIEHNPFAPKPEVLLPEEGPEAEPEEGPEGEVPATESESSGSL